MTRHDLDIIFCHFPMIILINYFVPLQELFNIEGSVIGFWAHWAVSAIYLISIIYGIHRVVSIKVKGASLFLWAFLIIGFPFFTLPYFFWNRLWQLRHD